MIFTQNTENNTGVAICGDYNDLNNLYEALQKVVGNEEDYPALEQSRLRVLRLCYELRHAATGEGEIRFIENGINEDLKRSRSLICPDKNVYMKTKIFWPEALFIMMALNEFLGLYAAKLTKKSYGKLFTDSKTIWDLHIVTVRQFQGAVANSLSAMVTPPTFTRMLNIMNCEQLSFTHFLTQYIDLLNHRFIKMSVQKRLKSVSVTAKRIAERDREYLELELDLKNVAQKDGCRQEDLELSLEFPSKIEW